MDASLKYLLDRVMADETVAELASLLGRIAESAKAAEQDATLVLEASAIRRAHRLLQDELARRALSPDPGLPSRSLELRADRAIPEGEVRVVSSRPSWPRSVMKDEAGRLAWRIACLVRRHDGVDLAGALEELAGERLDLTHAGGQTRVRLPRKYSPWVDGVTVADGGAFVFERPQGVREAVIQEISTILKDAAAATASLLFDQGATETDRRRVIMALARQHGEGIRDQLRRREFDRAVPVFRVVQLALVPRWRPDGVTELALAVPESWRPWLGFSEFVEEVGAPALTRSGEPARAPELRPNIDFLDALHPEQQWVRPGRVPEDKEED